jgi:hypothetical protein
VLLVAIFAGSAGDGSPVVVVGVAAPDGGLGAYGVEFAYGEFGCECGSPGETLGRFEGGSEKPAVVAALPVVGDDA